MGQDGGGSRTPEFALLYANSPLTASTTPTHRGGDGDGNVDLENQYSLTAPEVIIHPNPMEDWLPITASRNGNAYLASFHLLNSGIGFQALVLPVAFLSLGWAWGIVSLSLAFFWQLYTKVLLIRLHESVPGTRFSRYLQLAMAAFGNRLGKLAALFPVMYLSGGSCVVLIITGGGAMRLFFKAMCNNNASCEAKSLTGVQWFLVFTCIAILIAQLPNLNSIALVSLVGSIAVLVYCTLSWVLSVRKGKLSGISHSRRVEEDASNVDKMSTIVNSLGIIVLAFRGQNVLLEIQGTIPSNPKHPSKEAMYKAVTMSYTLIAACVFPMAIAGFWAYGNTLQSSRGLLIAFAEFHGQGRSKGWMGILYGLVVAHCLCAFQVYAMPVFDNLELRYCMMKKKRCPALGRAAVRVVFGGFVFFLSVTFPFLPSLAPVLGGLTMPLTYAYPCFMWMAIKKPPPCGVQWCFNLFLGCLGLIFAALLVFSGVWILANQGLRANFFKP